MSYASAVKAKIVCEAMSLFHGSEFTIFSDFVAQILFLLLRVLGGRTGFTQNKWLPVVFVLIALV